MKRPRVTGEELNALWNELEKEMGEMAAYHVACEQLGVDPDDGWSLLAKSSDAVSCDGKHCKCKKWRAGK